MNNKEKREYINCSHLRENINCCTVSEMMQISEVLSKCPSSLFKYRSFDKYAFSMIEEKYLYLTPVKDLDDPFDCLSDFGTSDIVGNGTINDTFIEHIYKEIPFQKAGRKSVAIAKKYKDVFSSNGFDREKARKAVLEEGLIPSNQIESVLDYLENMSNISKPYVEDKTFERFGMVLKEAGERVGVCSLSEINDNKVMWSLYCNEYKGYCVEYSIRNTKEGRRFLFPVIYTRKPNNNFIKKMFDSMFGELNRQVYLRSNPREQNSVITNVGAIYELSCVKDIDWRFQKEWRVVGEPEDHFTEADIKAVYLGFKVSKSNENKMIRLAKKQHFNLFKMKSPNGKKRIEYLKLV